MTYTLNQAAKATGKAKSTINGAIKRGRITAIKGDDGNWIIDPAELHRVYPPVSAEQNNRTPRPNNSDPLSEHANGIENLIRIKELAAELKAATDLVDILKADKEFLQGELKKSSLLLTGARAQSAENPPPRGFWQWLMGRKTA